MLPYPVVQGIKLRSSGLAAGPLTCWLMSLALALHFWVYLVYVYVCSRHVVQAPEQTREVLEPWAAVSCLMWLLGSRLLSCERVECVPGR